MTLQSWTWNCFAFFAAANLISQSAMDLFATLFCVGALVLVARRTWSLPSLRASVSGVFFLLWLLVTVVGLVINSDLVAAPAWEKVAQFRWILVAVLGAVVLREMPPGKKHEQAALILVLATSLYAILIFVLRWDPLRPEAVLDTFPDGTVRTGGFLQQPIVFAQVYGIWAGFLAGGLAARFVLRREWSPLSIATLICLGLALLLSFTRGIWLALPLAVAISLGLLRPLWGLGIALVVSGATWVLSQFWPAFQQRLLQALQGGDQERLWIWKANWAMFQEHPWWGVGYSHNVELLPRYYELVGAPSGLIESHAHNQYLHILAGVGLLGFFAYILFWGSLMLWLSKGFRRQSSDPVTMVAAFCALTVFVLGGAFESNFEHSKIRYTLAILLAVAIANSDRFWATCSKD